MTRCVAVSLAVGILLSSLSCATKQQAVSDARRSESQAVPAGSEYPIIVRLVGRHYDITASSGPVGPVYTAATHDGKLVVANASLVELRDRHPEIYEQIIPTIAEHADSRSAAASKPGIEADASSRSGITDVKSSRHRSAREIISASRADD
jgi:hypothetical protein